ncbi:MAG: arginase family protein, partial [Gaiellaceae bacterium]
ARPARARPARRPRRHLGRVLRPALLPRDDVPARGRGGADRSLRVGAGGPARLALRGGGSRLGAGAGLHGSPCDELRTLGPDGYASLVEKRVGPRPVFLSFDIDVLDPAFAPGTGTPEVGGLSTAEALACLRALRGIDLAGADVVEVSPAYDGPGQQTALAAANVAYELLSLCAVTAQRR